jgi:N-acetylglucosamine-6-phosphate deacetylase
MKKFTFEFCQFESSQNPEIVSIAVEDGLLTEISGFEVLETENTKIIRNLTVLPGFIDIHIHGAVGVDVNDADGDGLIRIAGFLAQNGVTSWVPTLVPDSDESYGRAIDAIDELMIRQQGKPISQAVGVHYEGVFANEKMCGALRPEYFKSGRLSGVLGQLPKLAGGVHMTTLAPEIEGGIEVIEELVADGWVVAIGHTRADAETLDRAFTAGARHMTHFFNAMTGLHHRNFGAVGWGLTNGDVTFDIIADGVHVHPTILKLGCRAKTPDLVTLISDSVAPTGLGDGEYQLWGETISVESGKTRNERGSIAGSVATLGECVKNIWELGFSESEISMMASANPASLLGLVDRGSIEIGKRADLVGLDASGNVAFTMIGGQIVES